MFITGMPQLMVQDGEKLGRRKAMAGCTLFSTCYTQLCILILPYLPCLPYLPYPPCFGSFSISSLPFILYLLLCYLNIHSNHHHHHHHYHIILFLTRVIGKESGPTVTAVESTSQSNAVSERDAMALLTRFQFPSKRWYVPYVL